MGFLTPADPPVEIDEWSKLPPRERLKPLAQDWALNGFGTPYAVFLLYVVKCAIFVVGAALVISATSGLGGLGDIDQWWSEPIVFQKLIVWTLLWEFIGLGAGSMPLTFRFVPPIGGVLHWLRPGTVRQPPWPDKVPLTSGTTRTAVDSLLAATVIGAALYMLVADGDPVAGTAAGALEKAPIVVLLAALGLLGLRDKVPFLAARSEHYATLLVVFLFPLDNLLVASQLVWIALWLGAASSKLNSHFPFVVTVMNANAPLNRSKRFKQLLWRNHPDDLLPSRFGRALTHFGTAFELGVPVVLLVTAGGTVGTIAAIAMIVFHINIFTQFPLAVPLEWNLVMIFGIGFLFLENGAVPLDTLDEPLLIAFLAVVLVGIPVLGNMRPDKISFLPSMRYYAGNWATSQWCFEIASGAEKKLDRGITKAAKIVVDQVEPFYGREMAELLLAKGAAFRAMHSHGRALVGLWPRAMEDPARYSIREGELISGIVNGYNFGDGHFHNEGLLAAVQERCGFEPGELRVIMLEGEPVGRGRGTQHYRIHDAATGLVEEGYVRVADMVTRQPWLDDSGTIPVEVTGGPGLAGAGAPPAPQAQ